jgi:aminoglycoside 6'-N-acetyltransferase
VVRRAQWRAGRWHDQVLFSLLRNEFEPETARNRPDTD